jgi:tRNA threonylcarbamoyladenosine biosynthesis protein TsaB
MRILGIDTSTLAASVALVKDSNLIAEHLIDDRESHSLKVLPIIDSLLQQANLELGEMDAFCVSAGPGSFTGLRVGMSIMKGFSLATGRPMVGVPTLEAMAATMTYADKQVCPVIDARKKEVYCALFKAEEGKMRRITEDMALKPDALCDLIKEPTIFLGDGIRAYGELFRERLREMAFLDRRLPSPSVAAQAAMMCGRSLSREKSDEKTGLHYVRLSEAEIKRSKQSAGAATEP